MGRLRSKRIFALFSIFIIFVVLFSSPKPVAGQPSVLTLRTWGGSYSDTASAVATDRSDNIYVAGQTSSFGPGSPNCETISLLKYSALGNLLWQKLWNNGSSSQATGIALDSSGNIYISGSVNTSCNGYYAGVLIKLDPNGNILWQKTMNQAVDNSFSALAVDSAGNAFVAGTYNNGIQGSQDILIARFDPSGNLVWQKSWGGSGPDIGNGIALDSSDNVYVAGTTDSFPTSEQRMVLLKLDSSGTFLFQKIVGNNNQFGTSVGLDQSGNIYTVGYSPGRFTGILVVKFDSTGGPVWQRSWGGTHTDLPTGLALDSLGNLEISGYTNSYGAGNTCGPFLCYSMLLLKLDDSGNLLSNLVYGNATRSTELAGVADLFGLPVAVGSVDAAPPYQTYTGNNTLGDPSFIISSQGNSTLGLPTYPIADVNGGTMLTPSGSQTYAGSSDEVMLRYGELPTLTFAAKSGGTITFNGTTYSNGQNATFQLGNATAIANTPSGYTFAGWSTTGGVFVSNPTSSNVQVTVEGSGTLTANFQQTSYILYYAIGGAAAAAVAIALAFLFMRKRKHPLQKPAITLSPTGTT